MSSRLLEHVLIIADLQQYSRRMSSNEWIKYRYWQDHGGATLFGPGHPLWREDMAVQHVHAALRKPYKVIYHQDCLGGRNCHVKCLDDCDAIKIFDLQDVHLPPAQHFVSKILRHRFDAVTHRVDCPHVDAIRRGVGDKAGFHHLPHYISTEIFHDRTLPKTCDVLLYGAVSDAYPFRRRLCRLLPLANGLRVKRLRHPGYGTDARGVTGERLSRLINQSWLTICTRSRYDYLLAKYVEVPMSGSVIAGDIPSRHEWVFGDDVVRIDDSMTDAQILDTIRNALADKDELRNKARRLGQRVRERFSLERGYEDLCRILAQIAADTGKSIPGLAD